MQIQKDIPSQDLNKYLQKKDNGYLLEVCNNRSQLTIVPLDPEALTNLEFNGFIDAEHELSQQALIKYVNSGRKLG